ncbi:MAG: PEP/pyruvate-binding domain-containing protein [Candidatus Eisenbacteria bacterium]
MSQRGYGPHNGSLAPFDRQFFTGEHRFTSIGSGSIGGKAHGLARMKSIIESKLKDRFTPAVTIDIPTLTVISTDHFDLFMKQNRLEDIVLSDTRDDLIAHAFQNAELPAQVVGDLRALAHEVHTPLAVRSSSMLEDAMFEPFASIYGTKMTPCNQPDPDARFRRLIEAIKLIYASTFFSDARSYMKSTNHTTMDEKMAVIIQEVVGTRFGNRYYPHISGVARSHNFYPFGHARPEEGVVDLALGLGKTIVDEGCAWSYSPEHPQVAPPYNSVGDLLKQTQTDFWAINMGKPPAYDPINEVEYMVKCNIVDGEYDGSLDHLVSTFRPENERIVMGIQGRGPRIVDFAPILKAGVVPINDLVRLLLKTCEDALGTPVEIEFAVTLGLEQPAPARFGFLQLRPMVVSAESVDVRPEDMVGEDVILASETVTGNGCIDTIRDVVYVKRETFEVNHTARIAEELDEINCGLADAKQPYLLIGFGRWGTSDPQGGIPVKFGQIAGAKVIVEVTLPDLDFGMSQGSHFFHNLTSFRIIYFSVRHSADYKIDWDRLNRQPAVQETEFVRHVRFDSPLLVKADGRTGMGVIQSERA